MNKEETKFVVQALVSLSLMITALNELHKSITDFLIQKGALHDKTPRNTDFTGN